MIGYKEWSGTKNSQEKEWSGTRNGHVHGMVEYKEWSGTRNDQVIIIINYNNNRNDQVQGIQ